MKITKVDIVKANCEAPGNVWVENVWHPMGVRIYTDEGIYGDGEAALAFGVSHNAAIGILKDFAPMIIGMDPMENEVIWNKLHRTTFWGQNGGPIVFAGIAAIDMALWDIRGKALGVPVYKLLGGKMQSELRCYASQVQGGWGEKCWKTKGDTAAFVENCLIAVDQGYDAIKIDVVNNFDGQDISINHYVPIPMTQKAGLLSQKMLGLFEGRIAAIREAVGPDVDIIVENHGDLDAEGAIQFANRIEKYHIFYFEEPNTASPYTAKRIRENTRIPIAHGERVYSRWQYNPYFENGALSIIQPDMGNCGGITETKKICDTAYSYDVGVQLHVCGSPLSTAAALQVECTLPNFVIHEQHIHATQEYNLRLAKYGDQVVDGKYAILDRPGLGEEWSDYVYQTGEIITIQ